MMEEEKKKKNNRKKSYEEFLLRTTIKHFIALFGIIILMCVRQPAAKNY